MKAIVVNQYGGTEVLKFEEYPDPAPGPAEVLVRAPPRALIRWTTSGALDY